ncbi:MAG: type IV toxin-antitoxin system AbiEi family antitoxin domain-containing protein [Christensenellales bacterium]|jgi:hypothetical protein|nr:type IV toxin-antitoxin system AbiEi family antitoxin domain-containing protein [Clostridiales bacterium]
MSYEQKIIEQMQINNGYITNKMTRDLEIPSIYLTRMTKEDEILNVSRGIYILPNIIEDELYINYLRYSKIVYTGNTALVLNEMSNRSLKSIEANVPSNYNTHRIESFVVNRVNDIQYSLGKTFKETEYGNLVPTYDKERMLCDVFLHDILDNEALNYAIQAAKKQDINYEQLYNYACILDVYDKIKFLLEIRV